MLRACYLLENSINKIARMGKSLSANSDLDVLKNRVRFEYRNSLVYFNELVFSLNQMNDFFHFFYRIIRIKHTTAQCDTVHTTFQ